MDKRILQAVEACVKCGICRGVCPVFREEKQEPFVARGHIALFAELIKGNIDFREETSKDYLYKCLLCTTCVEACPNDAPTDMIVEFARYHVIKHHSLPLYKRVMARVMKSRTLMDLAHRTSGLLSGLLFERIENAPREATRVRFTAADSDKMEVLPPVKSGRSFIQKYKTGSLERATVAIFPGCLINYTYTDVGDAFVKILKRLGISFMVPQDQPCCGAPIFASGNLKDAEQLAKRNIELVEKLNVEKVVVLEPTCASFMIHEYERLFMYLEQPEWEKRARKAAEKIIDPVKYLFHFTQIKSKLNQTRLKTTYHDACHLKRTQKVYMEPRELIRAASNFTEMKGADVCCGNGGTFSVDYPELSKKIASRKVKNIVKTDADHLIVGCSACMMQLTAALHREGFDGIKTMHTLELLAMALEV